MIYLILILVRLFGQIAPSSPIKPDRLFPTSNSDRLTVGYT
ncbi:hypothetical protein [Pseudanabaena minima]